MARAKYYIDHYMVLQFSKHFHCKVFNGFPRQDSQGLYNFRKIQNVWGPEISEKNI